MISETLRRRFVNMLFGHSTIVTSEILPCYVIAKKLEEGLYDIPIVVLGYCSDNINTFKEEKVIGLRCSNGDLRNSILEKRKTWESAISYIAGFSDNRCHRMSVDDTIYYVGCGIILDKDFNPLLLMSTIVDRRAAEINRSRIWHSMKKEIKIRISSRIFTEYNKLSNFIIKKLIPAYYDNLIKADACYWDAETKVVVDEFELFTKVNKPKIDISDDICKDIISKVGINNPRWRFV